MFKAIELASHLTAHPLDRYTVFEKQYNFGVELMKSIDLIVEFQQALTRIFISREPTRSGVVN